MVWQGRCQMMDTNRLQEPGKRIDSSLKSALSRCMKKSPWTFHSIKQKGQSHSSCKKILMQLRYIYCLLRQSKVSSLEMFPELRQLPTLWSGKALETVLSKAVVKRSLRTLGMIITKPETTNCGLNVSMQRLVCPIEGFQRYSYQGWPKTIKV